MAIPKNKSLTSREILQLDLPEIQRYVTQTWGQSTPDDMFDLFVHLMRVINDGEARARELQAEVARDSSEWLAYERILDDFRDQKKTIEDVFWPLQEETQGGDPTKEAPAAWVEAVREPIINGNLPDGRSAVPFSMLPFITARQLVNTQQLYGGFLAGAHVFEHVENRVLQVGDWVITKAKKVAMAGAVFLVLAAAVLFLRKRG